MYAGRAVERADIYELFDHPRHPYTHGLMASIPPEDVPEPSQDHQGQVPALHEMPAGTASPTVAPCHAPLRGDHTGDRAVERTSRGGLPPRKEVSYERSVGDEAVAGSQAAEGARSSCQNRRGWKP